MIVKFLIIHNTLKRLSRSPIMSKGWVPAEHVGKITTSILDVLAREFFKQSKNKELDHGMLIKLSQACGYQAQLYSGLQKNIEYASRLESVEKTIRSATPEDLAMGNNPVLQEEANLKTQEKLR